MAEEFKGRLDQFLVSLIMKIGASGDLAEIQSNYDEIMDIFIKANFIPKEQIDQIIESELDASDRKIQQLKAEVEAANSAFKKAEEQKNGLNQKIQILEKNFEDIGRSNSALQREKSDFENLYKNLKSDFDILQSRFESLQSETEYYKKNLKKNFNMEKEIQQLTEENERLSNVVKAQFGSDALKRENEQLKADIGKCKSQMENATSELKNLSQSNSDLKAKLETALNELSECNDQLKVAKYKLEQLSNENKTLEQEKAKTETKAKEIEYASKMSKVLLEKQNKDFKREIEKLHKGNTELTKEKEELEKQLKDFQTYTNFAKVSKANYTKKDFSMLETMARKVEELEELNASLKVGFESVHKANKTLEEKSENLENIILYYMKLQGELKDIGEIDISQGIFKDILQMKLDNSTLLKLLFKNKTENIKLMQTIQDITVEFNQKLRKAVENK